MKHSIIAQKSGFKCCNYVEVKMLLFLETEILDVLNIEKNYASQRERGTESQSIQLMLKARDKLILLTQKSKFLIFDL